MKKKNFDLDWDWSKEDCLSFDNEKETLPIDKLERRIYAEYLYFYLKEKGKENNTVINLNAEWGAGKTFFVKRMYNSLKNHHPCIYIDAWKQDFSDDAFLTLFSSLITQIERYAGKIDARLQKTASSIGRFTKGILPEILAGLIKNYSGTDISDITKTAAELMLAEHKEKSEAIIKLKKELSFWAELSFKKGFTAPVFIFIDELDRCRPNYAISLLEIVKHIFNVDKFVFIISTDTNQLQHSIKNIYGNEFGANDYLSRFFHRRFSLKAPDINDLISEKMELELKDNFNTLVDNFFPKPSNVKQLSTNVSEIFNNFGLNLRDSIRNADRLIDLTISKQFKKKIDYLALLILMIIYDKDQLLFKKLIGRSTLDDTIDQVIRNNLNINSFGVSELTLTLDCSVHNLGIDYYWINSDSRRMLNTGIEEVAISAREYITDAIAFIKSAKRIKIQMRNNPSNNHLTFNDTLTSRNKVTLHRGALLEPNINAEIYTLSAYANFIELASSFE